MSYPTKYVRQYDYVAYQNSNPNRPLPSDKVNADLNAAARSTFEIVDFLKKSVRDDGALMNGAVGFDQLSPALQSAGIAPADAWAASKDYKVGNSVIAEGALYRCIVAHTSGIFDTDLAAGRWLFVANIASGPQGPQGPQGSQGPQGPQGTPGPDSLSPVGTAGFVPVSNGSLPVWAGFLQAGAGAVARPWQDKLRETVCVNDFGLTDPTGVGDSSNAFLAAIAALPGGGVILVPRGKYRVTQSLPLHSGLEFRGEGCTNGIFGLPTHAETPSYIFLDADAGSLFTHAAGVQMESVRFYDLSFGTRLNPTTVARGTTTGFTFSGSYPNDIKHLTFERCQFSNFGGYAIWVHDPLAPSANPDWNVCPVTMDDCAFFYNTVGISFETDNADYWQLNGTAFFQGAGAYGIICQRSGVLVLNQCFGGGGTMLVTGGNGTQSRDTITFIACQFENATAMLQVADNMASQRTYRPIKMISCVVESPILLNASCHFISEGSRYVNNIEVTVAGVLIDSYSDSFLSTTAINLVAGSSVRNFITHGADLPIGVRGPIIDGKCIRTASAAPTGGTITYVAGDITYNSAPAAGSPVGWVCTAGGAPGTWDTFGQIGATSQRGTVTTANTGWTGYPASPIFASPTVTVTFPLAFLTAPDPSDFSVVSTSGAGEFGIIGVTTTTTTATFKVVSGVQNISATMKWKCTGVL